MRQLVKTMLFGISLLSVTAAEAWNRPGHMTTASIAYHELQASNPEVIAKISTIMKSHPTPVLFDPLAAQEANADAKTERIFMEMSAWPDEMRAPEYVMIYHHDSWHWINMVYVPSGVSSFTPPAEIVENRVFEAFSRNAAIIKDTNASDADKAVALCWIFHLVGDIHQPLHTTALFNMTFPEGDRGGNSIPLRVISTGATSNLHSFWDGAVAWNPDPQAVREMAASLVQAYPKKSLAAQRPYVNPASFEAWGRQESAPLAISVAYESGNILNYPKDDSAYLLSTTYVTRAKEVAKERVALAGYRLAEVLQVLFASSSAR